MSDILIKVQTTGKYSEDIMVQEVDPSVAKKAADDLLIQAQEENPSMDLRVVIGDEVVE